MKKLFVSLVSLVLLAVIVISSVQLVPTIQAIDWESLKDHFTKDVKKYTLQVEAGEGGTVSEIQPEYESGTVVNLSATPNEGYIFTGWYTANDTYLTTAKNYSFAISKDTVLVAGFAPAPEDMEGAHQYFEELKNCSQDFSFTIQCDRPDAEAYLINNLTIVDTSILGSEWVEHEKNNFTVERIGDTNEFKISLAEGATYDEGTTYTAYLPETPEGEEPDATFVDNTNSSDSLNFTIEQEETEILDYKEGLVYLFNSDVPGTDEVLLIVDDGLAEGEEGDVIDYIVLPEVFGITVDTIFCVYYVEDEAGKPVIDEQSFFAKAQTVEPLPDGTIKVIYTLPELTEIFDNLDVYTDGEIDLEDQGVEITDETIEQIRYMLFTNEEFMMYVANVYEASEKALVGTGCEIETIAKTNFVDLFDITIKPKIKGNTASIEISVAANIPIYKAKKQVAHISFKLSINKQITVSYGASLKIKYKWWVIPVGVSSYDFWAGTKENETVTFAISAAYDTGSEGLGQLEENVTKELQKLKKGKNLYYSKVKDEFKKQGYDVESDLVVPLFTVKYYAGIVSFNFDVNFFLRFDAAVTVKYTSSSYEDVRVGIRSSSHGAQVYKTVNSRVTTSDWLVAGKFDMRAGLRVELYVSIAGLSKYIKAGVGFEAGFYFTMSGCASINRGYLAAKIERGVYIKLDAYYKIFSISGSWDFVEEKWSLSSFGYDEAIVAYCNANLNNATLSLAKNKTDLFDLTLLKVNVMNVDDVSMSIDSLDVDSNQYTIKVTVKNGKWLSYDKNTGELIVKKGAPLYFKDQITIEVTPKYKAWSAYKTGKVCVSLPKITLNVEFGNEDDYYDSIDNAMQKEFRRIYRNYNAGNAAILKSNFNNLIHNAITIPEKYADVFEYISIEYINQLFDTIGAYRLQEDDNRTMENRLVANEADVFKALIDYMNDLINSKTLKDSATESLLEKTLDSTVLYNTIVEVAYSDNCDKLAENFTRVDAATRETITRVIDEFVSSYQNSSEAQRAQALGAAFKELLGLNG